MKLSIGYFYREELNLYGDTGNIEILTARARARGFEVEVTDVTTKTKITSFADFNLIFMGGGPDSGQKGMYTDLVENKKEFLKNYIEAGGAALFICGSYQLMGKYYKSADGSILNGLEIFDLYTEHPGHLKQRCVGNVVCKISPNLTEKPLFKAVNHLGDYIVGFENHGGRTYLKDKTQSLAEVKNGFGNNGNDKTEGIIYKNALGTYLHGPFLSKNPHIADFLIATALKLDNLKPLDDNMIYKAYSALLARK